MTDHLFPLSLSGFFFPPLQIHSRLLPQVETLNEFLLNYNIYTTVSILRLTAPADRIILDLGSTSVLA